MDQTSGVQLPRGWDVKFGIKDLPLSTIIELAPDFSIALSEPGSTQMWIMDSNSRLELVVVESPITALCWISVDMICVGTSIGEITLVSRSENGFSGNISRNSTIFHNTAIKSLRISSMSGEGILSDIDTYSRSPQEVATLWLLYDDHTFIAVSISNLLIRRLEDSPLPQHVTCSLSPVTLKDASSSSTHQIIEDAIPCCHITPSLLDINGTLNTQYPKKISVLACGNAPYPISFYSLGDSSGKIQGFRQLARHAAHALKVTAVSFLSGFIGNKKEDGEEEEKTVISIGEYSGLRDDRRSIQRVVLDPSLRYALCSDTLGRVLLIDVSKHLVVRLFKGVREAQCGWIQEPPPPSSSSNISHHTHHQPLLYACIYSPRRGFVEIFAAVHGPKVRSITVGIQAKLLYTIAPSSESSIHLLPSNESSTKQKDHKKTTTCILATCGILRVNECGQDKKLELFKLDHIPQHTINHSLKQSNHHHHKVSSEVTMPTNPLILTCSLTTAISQLESSSGSSRKIDSASTDIFNQDLSLIRSLNAMVENINESIKLISFEDIEKEALDIIRKLRTSAGVQDACCLSSKLCTSSFHSKHLRFLRAVTEWALDANSHGVLLTQSMKEVADDEGVSETKNKDDDKDDQEKDDQDKDDQDKEGVPSTITTSERSQESTPSPPSSPTPPVSLSSPTMVSRKTPCESLDAFLKRRRLLLDTFERISELHEDNDVTATINTSSVPDGWHNEAWRAEAVLWTTVHQKYSSFTSSSSSSPSSSSSSSLMAVGHFLLLLERDENDNKTSLSPLFETYLTEISHFLFFPLLQDVFALSIITRAMKDIGPLFPKVLKQDNNDNDNNNDNNNGGDQHQNVPYCINPPILYIKQSSSSLLFSNENTKFWAANIIHLLIKWLYENISFYQMNQFIFKKSPKSNGIIRFLEGLLIHSLETIESANILNIEPREIASCWKYAYLKCLNPINSNNNNNNKQDYLLLSSILIIIQESHYRANMLLESQTYGVKSVPVSLKWNDLLCQLRCCLLFTMRYEAIKICFQTLVNKNIIPHIPHGILTPLPILTTQSFSPTTNIENSTFSNQSSSLSSSLSSSFITNKNTMSSATSSTTIQDKPKHHPSQMNAQEGLLMELVVRDRCALDLLYAHQSLWAQNNQDPQRSQDDQSNQTPTSSKNTPVATSSSISGKRSQSSSQSSSSTTCWPDPRLPNPAQSALWTFIAFDQILQSELSKLIHEVKIVDKEDLASENQGQGTNKNEVTESINKEPLSTSSSSSFVSSHLSDKDSFLFHHHKNKSLTLPSEWVPMIEFFCYKSIQTNQHHIDKEEGGSKNQSFHSSSSLSSSPLPSSSCNPPHELLSRICMHCHCAMMLSSLLIGPEPHDPDYFYIESMKISIAHIDAISRKQFPILQIISKERMIKDQRTDSLKKEDENDEDEEEEEDDDDENESESDEDNDDMEEDNDEEDGEESNQSSHSKKNKKKHKKKQLIDPSKKTNHHRPWYDFFDYDVPVNDGKEATNQTETKDSELRGRGVVKDKVALTLAAIVATRIFEDMLWPKVMKPFLIAQQDSQSDSSRLSNCFLRKGRSSQDVLEFCLFSSKLLDFINIRFIEQNNDDDDDDDDGNDKDDEYGDDSKSDNECFNDLETEGGEVESSPGTSFQDTLIQIKGSLLKDKTLIYIGKNRHYQQQHVVLNDSNNSENLRNMNFLGGGGGGGLKKDWDVNQGKEWLLGRAAALEKDIHREEEDDDDDDENDDDDESSHQSKGGSNEKNLDKKVISTKNNKRSNVSDSKKSDNKTVGGSKSNKKKVIKKKKLSNKNKNKNGIDGGINDDNNGDGSGDSDDEDGDGNVEISISLNEISNEIILDQPTVHIRNVKKPDNKVKANLSAPPWTFLTKEDLKKTQNMEKALRKTRLKNKNDDDDFRVEVFYDSSKLDEEFDRRRRKGKMGV